MQESQQQRWLEFDDELTSVVRYCTHRPWLA